MKRCSNSQNRTTFIFKHWLNPLRIFAQSDTPIKPRIEIRPQKLSRCTDLLGCLNALREGNSEEFSISMVRYLKSYMSLGLDIDCLDSFFSIDGTVLWLLAEELGFSLPDLPEHLESLIVTRRSLQLDDIVQ